MELQATMALDRDAVNTIVLRLLPPSTAPTSSTSWLLLHTIPITASLSRTLSRLVSIEEAAMAQAAASSLPPPLPQSATAAAATNSFLTRSTGAGATRDSASQRKMASSPSPPSPSSSSSSTAPSSLHSSFAYAPAGCIELVRVGYVVSEIHAYCILLKCRSPSQAARMKAALEEGAALGVTAPVEFVSETGVVTVTRRVFADPLETHASSPHSPLQTGGETGGIDDEAAAAGASPTSSMARSTRAARTLDVDGGNEGGRSGQARRWHCEVNTMMLVDAVTMIYPVRDNEGGEGSLDDVGNGKRGSNRAAELRRSVCAPSQPPLSNSTCRSLKPSPYPQMMRRPHSDQALSAPSSPSIKLQQQQHQQSPLPPASTFTAPSTPPVAAGSVYGRGGSSKGAAPSRPKAMTTAAAATPQRASPLSTPAAQADQHTQHTPLHLPNACDDARASPLRLDAGGERSSHALSQETAYGLHMLTEEFCAICQVDPLRRAACVTTLCQHSFHLHCYAQLPSSSAECPLCRFSVYDLLNDARCEVCGTYEDLWVCLVCGHVACGRARRDHQQEHYRSSGHSCAWQSSTNRIWNLSSRMFLHQEVALLLDGAEAGDEPNAEASGSDDASGMDRLQRMSWTEPFDLDLQEALNESKEEAVAHYYTEFLRQLAEEQQRYYERRYAEQRLRRERRCWRAEMRALEAKERAQRGTGAAHPPQTSLAQSPPPDSSVSLVASPSSPPPSLSPQTFASVHAIVREERRQRRRVLAEYASAAVALLQVAQRSYTALYNHLKAARDEAQQQVLLRSHLNSGLVAEMDQVRQRTQEAMRKGERGAQAKAAEEATLQKKVEEALSSL